jgi:integrase
VSGDFSEVKMALTVKRVNRLLAAGVPGRYLDRRGLYLEIKSKTNASRLRRYQLDGRERYIGLGSAFTFMLDEARMRAQDVNKLLADKIDPLVRKREAKAERLVAAARTVTFGECAVDYFRAHSPGWKHAKHIAQWRATVLGLTSVGKPSAGDYCKTLRLLPVAQIDTPLVLQVLRPLWHDRPETLSRVRARIASVLDYAKAAGYRTGDNPAAWDVIGKLLPARGKVARVNHYEAVPHQAMPAFVSALSAREGTAAQALKFLILTAARTVEVLHATWGEINFDDALWTVPPDRMKAGKEHRVPLAPEALELLHGLYRERDSDDGFLFIGPQYGKPLSEAALRAVMRRMGHTEVPHGLRSSFSDWAHERTGHSNHAIELSLAHSIGAATEKAYRRGDMLQKRRRLMADWARYCTSPPAIAKSEEEPEKKVVPIGRGRQ